MDQQFPGFELQASPQVLVCSLPGHWLLERATPSWRAEDPVKGFQRIVRTDRAKAMAVAVLDQQRTFPNAIVLATDTLTAQATGGRIPFKDSTRFLVVDGQHRLWAQRFSEFRADYASVIHTGLDEVRMAELFLEINDNQRRVPSSLRWDLVRLVRPDDDPAALFAAELSYALATDPSSPLYQRVDLTGEQSELRLKQGSLAPALKQLVGGKSALADIAFDQVFDLLVEFLVAVRDQEPDEWGTPSSRFYKARVIRALMSVMGDIVRAEGVDEVGRDVFDGYLRRISPESLDPAALTAQQGNAGIAAITRALRLDMFGDAPPST